MSGLATGKGLSASSGLSIATVGLWSGIEGFSNTGGSSPSTGQGIQTDAGVQLTTDAGVNINTSS